MPVWLRGDVPGVAAPLQAVAHGLLNMLEEVEQAVNQLPRSQLWQNLGGAASAGFHLRHIAGSTSRLFTYARGEELSDKQRTALALEKTATPDVALDDLLHELREVVDSCLAELRSLQEAQLDTPRGVGRAAHPSTVRGILHHAAEHAARHSGQVVTTTKIIAS